MYFFDALSALDDARMRNYLTSDFLLLENGEVWNADSLARNFSRMKGKEFTRKNSFRYIRTEQAGNAAMVAYHNRADIMFNGKPIIIEWLESAQLERRNKAWKIKLLHSTPIKPKTD